MNTSRTFRLVVAVAVLCAFCALPVFAQQDRPRGGQQDRPSVAELVGQLTKELKLTDDQKTKITDIMTQSRSGAQDTGGGNRRGGFGRQRQLTASIEAVLKPEQVEKYRAFMVRQQVDQRIERLTSQLTLTDDQIKKIRPIIEAENKKMTALREKMGESDDRSAMMEQMRGIRDESNKAIEAVLTPQQAETFRANATRRGGPRQ